MHSAGKSWARRQGCDGGRLEADPAEEHQVRITLVDPKGDFCFAVRIAELHTSEAIRVPLKVCKCVVEFYRADPFRLPKIVFGSLHGFPPDRKAALVGPQDRLPRYVQNQTVDSCGPKGQIAVLRLVQWELVATPVELIAPILQPVRPRDQHLAPARGTHLIGAISVEKLTAANRV